MADKSRGCSGLEIVLTGHRPHKDFQILNAGIVIPPRCTR
jgi:hypothetical protein